MAAEDDEQVTHLKQLVGRLRRDLDNSELARASDLATYLKVLGVQTEVTRVSVVQDMTTEHQYALLIRETEFETLLSLLSETMGGNTND